MVRKYEDLTNRRFGKLTVLHRTDNKPQRNKHIYWECACDCGNTHFVRGSSLRAGKSKMCKSCHSPFSKDGKFDSKLYGRDWAFKKKYDISLEDYDTMLSNQDNKCAICGKTPEENGKRLSVDHDHKTGNVRSLLCHKCNTALGMVDDDISTLIKLIDYISYFDKEA